MPVAKNNGPLRKMTSKVTRLTSSIRWLVPIAGYNYRPPETITALQELRPNKVLHLVFEPDNPYDSDAIKIVDPKTGLHFGYVPKQINKSLGQDMLKTESFEVRARFYRNSMIEIFLFRVGSRNVLKKAKMKEKIEELL